MTLFIVTHIGFYFYLSAICIKAIYINFRIALISHNVITASLGKTQGFLIYWIWTNVLHAVHWSRSVMANTGCGFLHKDIQYKEDLLAALALGIKMRLQSKRGRESFERNLWSSCSYKTPQIPTQTTACMGALFAQAERRTHTHMLTRRQKHTYLPASFTLSVTRT